MLTHFMAEVSMLLVQATFIIMTSKQIELVLGTAEELLLAEI
jgi:hypothetical protein